LSESYKDFLFLFLSIGKEGVVKALLQRVKQASVRVDGQIVAEINAGLLVFLGINKFDSDASCKKLLDKVLAYRMFSDEQGKMNLNLKQVNGELLVVSQFTLVADTQKGLRPSFSSAGLPYESERLYEKFIHLASEAGFPVEMGQFGANMQVSLINDGPVTFVLDI
jgi:D-tyrosyl-tRNA(Tyr) deacylase